MQPGVHRSSIFTYCRSNYYEQTRKRSSSNSTKNQCTSSTTSTYYKSTQLTNMHITITSYAASTRNNHITPLLIKLEIRQDQQNIQVELPIIVLSSEPRGHQPSASTVVASTSNPPVQDANSPAQTTRCPG